MKTISEVEKFCHKLWHLYLEERVYEELFPYLDAHVTVIGTGKHEVSYQLEELIEKLQEEKEWNGTFRIQKEKYHTTVLDNHTWLVMGELSVKEDNHEKLIYDFEFRFSVVIQCKEDWKILHIHQSVGDINQASDEFFPKRLIEQSNRQLRESIAEKTRELEESNKAVIYFSHHDYLTNMTNRYYFEKTVYEKMKQIPLGTFMILDIDRFKHFNDTYGHPIGDRILITLAHAMMDEFHDGICARMGGDEFAIYLPQKMDKMILKKRLQQMSKNWVNLQKDLKLKDEAHISAGSAYYPDDEDYMNMMVHADQALYACKKTEEIVCFYDEMKK